MRNERSLVFIGLLCLCWSMLCVGFVSYSSVRQPTPMTTTISSSAAGSSQTTSSIATMRRDRSHATTATLFSLRMSLSFRSSPNPAPTTTTAPVTTKSKRPKPVFLTHERDFFRQMARLESMDSYVLVSTLTASMSFGCLLGFQPSAAATNAAKTATQALLHTGLCQTIQVVSGLSALCGLYSTLIFSLTILYSKSALGAERDREYDKFIKRTVKARVRGFRSFTLSMGLFAMDAMLVIAERTSFRWAAVPAACAASAILFFLYTDWKLLHQSAEIIYKD
jgi:hypothetical protein